MRKIPGYERYAVDTLGNVWRIGAPRGIPLRPALRSGYPFVVLSEAGGKQARSVHHLVLETYVGPRPEGKEPCHRNGIKTDNRLDNLYWGTRAENIADKFRHGKQPLGESTYNAILTENAVRDIRAADGRQLDQLAKKYGVSRAAIEAARYGRNWKHVVR
jgi:hypothetical protein